MPLKYSVKNILVFTNSNCYYSSTVFDSCINTITSYFRTSILIWWGSSRTCPSSFCRSCTGFREDQLDFPVTYLENCKRISRWANWNSRWLQERSRWRHLDRNLRRWKEVHYWSYFLRWWKYFKQWWLLRTKQL